MGLWRCMNLKCAEGRAKENGQCGFDFEADKPVCPKCGGDRRKDKRLVEKLETIHFEEIGSTIGNITAGKGEIACVPGHKLGPLPEASRGKLSPEQEKKLENAAIKRSAAPTAVTCPECKKTQVWKDAMEAHGESVEDKDFPVEVDLQAGMMRVGDRPSG